MPLQRCEIDGGPGWKWGDAGACYSYTAGDDASEQAARDKAMKQAAAMGEFPGTGQNRTAPLEILYRSGTILTDTVNFKDRIIDVVAVPWEERAEIMWRGDKWGEVFERGAFDETIEAKPRIPVNREHVYGDTVGRIVHMRDAEQGLLAAVKVAKTPRGDDTLQLAAEGILGASLGYFLRKMSDVLLDKRLMLRRVRSAAIEHLAMVEVPAFPGAQTIAVHDGFTQHPEAGARPLVTPSLDEWIVKNAEFQAWIDTRLGK